MTTPFDDVTLCAAHLVELLRKHGPQDLHVEPVFSKRIGSMLELPQCGHGSCESTSLIVRVWPVAVRVPQEPGR